MSNKYNPIAIALGGVCQHTMLVPELANTGLCDNEHYHIVLKSIFNTQPDSAADVFGGTENIHAGLTFLTQLLAHNQSEKMEMMRYLFGTLAVTNKLLKNQDALDKIAHRLTRIKPIYDEVEQEENPSHRDELYYSLAGIYSDIISPLASKIRVTGKIEYLQNTLIQAKIRTALLGGVRSAMLWHQVGGGRLQFIFARKSIIAAANSILQQS